MCVCYLAVNDRQLFAAAHALLPHRMASAQAVNQGGPEKPAAKSHFNVCFRQSVYYTIIGRGKSATSQAVNAGSLHPTADEADHQPCMHD